MTNKLLQDNWGDNSVSYTEAELAAAKRRFRRQDTVVWTFIVLASAVLLCALL